MKSTMTAIAVLCIYSTAAAQGPQGTVRIVNPSISGSYFGGAYVGTNTSSLDTASAFISATYKTNTGANAYGYTYATPKMKYKYYDANGNIINQPDTMDASPISFGSGGVGYSEATSQATCQTFGALFSVNSSGGPLTTLLPYPARTLIRQWKLFGYAGSQQAYAGDECNVLAPSFDTTTHGSVITKNTPRNIIRVGLRKSTAT